MAAITLAQAPVPQAIVTPLPRSQTLGIKLPIILDSPSGKEVDQANIQLMVDILKRDFADNQIIIASIFTYAFDNVNTIKIRNRLLE